MSKAFKIILTYFGMLTVCLVFLYPWIGFFGGEWDTAKWSNGHYAVLGILSICSAIACVAVLDIFGVFKRD